MPAPQMNWIGSSPSDVMAQTGATAQRWGELMAQAVQNGVSAYQISQQMKQKAELQKQAEAAASDQQRLNLIAGDITTKLNSAGPGNELSVLYENRDLFKQLFTFYSKGNNDLANSMMKSTEDQFMRNASPSSLSRLGMLQVSAEGAPSSGAMQGVSSAAPSAVSASPTAPTPSYGSVDYAELTRGMRAAGDAAANAVPNANAAQYDEAVKKANGIQAQIEDIKSRQNALAMKGYGRSVELDRALSIATGQLDDVNKFIAILDGRYNADKDKARAEGQNQYAIDAKQRAIEEANAPAPSPKPAAPAAEAQPQAKAETPPEQNDALMTAFREEAKKHNPGSEKVIDSLSNSDLMKKFPGTYNKYIAPRVANGEFSGDGTVQSGAVKSESAFTAGSISVAKSGIPQAKVDAAMPGFEKIQKGLEGMAFESLTPKEVAATTSVAKDLYKVNLNSKATKDYLAHGGSKETLQQAANQLNSAIADDPTIKDLITVSSVLSDKEMTTYLNYMAQDRLMQKTVADMGIAADKQKTANMLAYLKAMQIPLSLQAQSERTRAMLANSKNADERAKLQADVKKVQQAIDTNNAYGAAVDKWRDDFIKNNKGATEDDIKQALTRVFEDQANPITTAAKTAAYCAAGVTGEDPEVTFASYKAKYLINIPGLGVGIGETAPGGTVQVPVPGLGGKPKPTAGTPAPKPAAPKPAAAAPTPAKPAGSVNVDSYVDNLLGGKP